MTQSYSTWTYKCVLTNEDGTVESDIVGVTVVVPKVPPVIDTQPTTAEAAIGDTVTFTVASSNATSYQWKYKTATGTKWNNIREDNAYFTGGKTDTLTFALTQTYSTWTYKCVLTNEDGTVESDIVGITIVIPTINIDGVIYKQLTDTTAEIINYEGSASSLTIPATVNFNGTICRVTEVGKEAFMNNTSLISISLPNSITVIRSKAFYGCSALSNMTTHD